MKKKRSKMIKKKILTQLRTVKIKLLKTPKTRRRKKMRRQKRKKRMRICEFR